MSQPPRIDGNIPLKNFISLGNTGGLDFDL